MPSDYGHEFADKELKKLESKLTKEYKQAAKEVEKKMKDFLSKFEEKDKKMLAKVQSGEMTAKEYVEWRKGQIMTGKRWEDMRDTLAQDLVNVDKIAAGMINDSLPNAYAENMNFGTYEVESGVNIDTGFTLYDKNTVKNLMKKDPQIIPQARIDIPKDELWNRKKLTSAVMQGILQGESIPNIAKRLRSVADMDRNAAIRNARTYTTAAENKGRVDSYERAKDMGIQVKQMWMATLDDRTRVEHRHLDGQVREIGEDFEADGYKIRYPGDPSAEPEMIYCCRCTLVADLPKYGKDLERNESKLGDMTYEEWKKAKDKPSVPEPAKEEQPKEQEEIKHEPEYDNLKGWMQSNSVTYISVNELKEQLDFDEIVQKIGGGDETDGSCASLSLAYCANKQGLDVTDFRGGDSQYCFANKGNNISMYKLADADIQTFEFVKEAKEATKLLNDLPVDDKKEYVLGVGKHSAIIRKTTEFGLQYLELQSQTDNGWHSFETEKYTTFGTLVKRFGCRKTPDKNYGIVYKKKAALIDVESIKITPDFKEMLGYINTAKDKQQKGEKGGIK